MPTTAAYSVAAIAWKGVTRKLFRNVVLVLAVALLVALLVFALLFNRAVTEDIEAATQKLGADIVLVPSEAKGNAEEFILESKIKSFYMDKFVFESISDLPEIKQATYHVYLNTLSSGCCSIDEGQVIAYDQEHDFVIAPWVKVGPPKLASGEVYVGSYVYDYLGLINTASLFGKGVKVVGHLQRTNTGLDHGVFMRLDDLDKISESAMGDYKHGTISIIFIKLKEGADAEKVVADIRKINPAIGIMSRGDIGAGVRNTLKDITRVFSITILISATLAVLLAWSTFTAMANERRREVGILRAIGARQSHIMHIFLLEATIISGLGGLIGIGVGHILIRYLAGDFNLLSKLGAVSALNMGTVLLSFAALLAGVIVCLIGAAMPTIRLARMEPLNAIKED